MEANVSAAAESAFTKSAFADRDRRVRVGTESALNLTGDELG